jgi:hypothetical protein
MDVLPLNWIRQSEGGTLKTDTAGSGLFCLQEGVSDLLTGGSHIEFKAKRVVA